MNAYLGIVLLALPGILSAQAAAEAAMASGAAVNASGGMQKAGKAIAGKLQGLNPAVAKSKAVVTETKVETRATAKAEATAEPKPAVTYEDPAGIEKGMAYDEVMRRFGPPSMKITSAPGVETLDYSGKASTHTVTMRNGKVEAIQTLK